MDVLMVKELIYSQMETNLQVNSNMEKQKELESYKNTMEMYVKESFIKNIYNEEFLNGKMEECMKDNLKRAYLMGKVY